jgi:serine/threonine protein kinase
MAAAKFIAKLDAPLKRFEALKANMNKPAVQAQDQKEKLPPVVEAKPPREKNVINMVTVNNLVFNKFSVKETAPIHRTLTGLNMGQVAEKVVEQQRPPTTKFESPAARITRAKIFALKLLKNPKTAGLRPQSANVRGLQNILNANVPPPPPQTTQQIPSDMLKNGMEAYRIDRVLGQGAYAVVRLAFEKATNARVAIKSYEKFKLIDANRRKNVKREIAILSQLDHPNVIKLVTWLETPTQYNLIMEFVSDRSLYHYLKSKALRKVSEAEARVIFRQIVAGIAYCHNHNVAHRDIKLENILIDDHHRIKVIDFGFAINTSPKDKHSTFCGTPSYMAPEIVNKKEYFGHCVDNWALGILLFALLNGRFPFKGSDEKDLYRRISRGQFEVPAEISSGARELIQKILNINPAERYTTKDVDCLPFARAKQNV